GERETAGDFSRSTEVLRQDIAAKRAAITDTVDRLGDKVEQTFDWRTYISEYPLVALGLAAGLGAVASAVFKPRPSPGQRVLEALADGVEDATRQFRNNFSELTRKKKGVGDTVKAAAAAMVTKALSDYLKNRLGGFENNAETAPPNREREQNLKRERIANSDRTASRAV